MNATTFNGPQLMDHLPIEKGLPEQTLVRNRRAAIALFIALNVVTLVGLAVVIG